MNNETLKQLQEMVMSRDIRVGEFAELIIQATIFDARRSDLEKEYPGKVVAVCGGEVFSGLTLEQIRETIRKKIPRKPFYAKKFPSLESSSHVRSEEEVMESLAKVFE